MAENREKVFYSLTFLVTWIYGVCSIMLVTFLNPFVNVWIGSKYLLDPSVVFALAFEFYISGIQYAGYNYAITTGLFKKAKWGTLTSSILNIILSIIFGLKWGLFGILFATGISRLCAQTWLDPYLVFKYEFNKSSKPYFLKVLRNFILVCLNLIIVYYLSSLVKMDNFLLVFLYAIAFFILTNIIFFLLFFKTWEFKDLIERIKLLFKKN